jgi:hypothetical protein
MPGTLTALTFARGANGEEIYARSAPLYIDARVLAANTNETHTVPAGAEVVLFAADGDYYAKPNGAAAVPTDTTDGSASEYKPVIWYLTNPPVTTIGLISEAARKITLSFYKLKNS